MLHEKAVKKVEKALDRKVGLSATAATVSPTTDTFCLG